MQEFSEEYLKLLREFEGYFAEPYLCPTGHCTIGYGTNLEAHRKFIPYNDIRENKHVGEKLRRELINRGMRWDRSKAESAMIEELNGTHEELIKRCDVYRTLREKGENVRADALLDMAYNMGIRTLLTFRNSLASVAAGKYKTAAANMRLSRWYRQVGRRGRAICSMMETGMYPKEIR